MQKYYLLFMLYWALGNIQAQNLYFPPIGSTQWDTLSPTTLGYCPNKIDSLYQYLDQADSKAFILLKDGKVVLEKYFDTFDQDSLWYWASAGKSLTAYLVGIAQQENYLNITDSTSQYLGNGWTDCTPSQEEAITIWNQLTMTSGLDDGVSNPNCIIDTCLQYLAPVGSRWAYHNAPYTLLDDVIRNATGRSLNLYLYQKINRLTGMSGAYVGVGDNTVHFSTARSMARFGLLTLNKGNWNGTPILSDSTYFNSMVNSSQAINPAYGYLWWLNGKTTYRLPQLQFNFSGLLMPNAPIDAIMALGKNGQLINVVPSQNLVWIRMGNGSGNSLVPNVFNDSTWIKINDLTCGTTSMIEYGTSDTEAIEIVLYPNPSHDQLQIRSNKTIASIQIYNSLGQLQYSNNKPTSSKIEVSDWTPALYNVRLKTADGLIIHRVFVKQ